MENKEFYINKLSNILKEENIPSSYYNFNGYAEESVCLEQLTYSFLVYTAERNNKYAPTEHTNIIDACKDIISRLSKSKEEYNKILNKLLNK